MAGLRAALTLIRAIPDLMGSTRHMSWLVRMRYLAACFRFYRDESRDAEWRRSRPRCGNPALRASCCDSRPTSYSENSLPGDIPELAAHLQPAGTGWSGYIQFFDCTVCGQEWMLDWQPSNHGGIQQLRKLVSKTSDG